MLYRKTPLQYCAISSKYKSQTPSKTSFLPQNILVDSSASKWNFTTHKMTTKKHRYRTSPTPAPPFLLGNPFSFFRGKKKEKKSKEGLLCFSVESGGSVGISPSSQCQLDSTQTEVLMHMQSKSGQAGSATKTLDEAPPMLRAARPCAAQCLGLRSPCGPYHMLYLGLRQANSPKTNHRLLKDEVSYLPTLLPLPRNTLRFIFKKKKKNVLPIPYCRPKLHFFTGNWWFLSKVCSWYHETIVSCWYTWIQQGEGSCKN